MRVLCVTLGLLIRTTIAGFSCGSEVPSREVFNYLRDELSILHGSYPRGNHGGSNLDGGISLVNEIGGPSTHSSWQDELGYSIRPEGLSNNYFDDLEFDSIQRLFEFEDNARNPLEETLPGDKLGSSTSRESHTTENRSGLENEINEAGRLDHMTLDGHGKIGTSSEPDSTEESMKTTSETLKHLKGYTKENIELSKALIRNNLQISKRLVNANTLFLKKIKTMGSKLDLTKIDLKFLKELTDIGLKDLNSFTKNHYEMSEELTNRKLELSISLNLIRLKILQRIVEKNSIEEIPDRSDPLTHENLSQLDKLTQENVDLSRELVEGNVDLFRDIYQSQMNLLETLDHHKTLDEPNSFSSRINPKTSENYHIKGGTIDTAGNRMESDLTQNQGILKRKRKNIAMDSRHQESDLSTLSTTGTVKSRGSSIVNVSSSAVHPSSL
ncbi:uncharacterized protein MELLADRAFT_109431 [Melampsora larici-populina 98AG31]|uniref:Secreted protein n=1 Tax=Melampsora larici-populina (strain 98AG31 / pathotype 3-4-7) TaxID=747676 RepID=F4RWG3_MELLP|nr:uncharacterized protein MELLADRAFT_109431 [Melampsora larici-populina 98AG31]EGG03279.1 hypothetical protein MELLADRAFT_109431 [Melampsora larici-populina 98AG31]